MDELLSRSEKKRRAKSIENLAKELAALPITDIEKLPCDVELKKEIKTAKEQKGPALKRQVKYIARELRKLETDPILSFLAQKKGSKLKKKQEFHELEHLRDAIINAAIAIHDEMQQHGETTQDKDLQGNAIDAAIEKYPALDIFALKTAALRFATLRKVKYSREVFRILQAAHEQAAYTKKGDI